MRKKKNIFKKATPQTIEEKTIVAEVKPEKKIINAVSVVVLDNDSEETKDLLKKLQIQKTEFYPETEIVITDKENVNLLDLTKGQYIVYFKKGQTITKDFLHQLYINMRGGKESFLFDNVYCIDRKIVKTERLEDITEDLIK